MHFYADELLEDVNNLLHMQLSLASHRGNEVMRVLTIFSAFFLPLTFVVGIYGMNFHYMPELTQPWGYPAGLGAHDPHCPRDLRVVPEKGVVVMSLAISGGNLGWFAGGAVATALLLRLIKRSGGRIGGSGADPSLLPEPGLDWLRRAHGAKGVWISERGRPGEATVWHRAISEKALSPAHVAVVGATPGPGGGAGNQRCRTARSGHPAVRFGGRRGGRRSASRRRTAAEPGSRGRGSPASAGRRGSAPDSGADRGRERAAHRVDRQHRATAGVSAGANSRCRSDRRSCDP